MNEKKNSLWGKAYILLMLSNFFSWLSYNMVTPVLTGYMETLGASVSLCGIVGGLFAFTSCFSRPFSGYLSDSCNRKRLMSLFTFIMAFSLLIYSIIPNVYVIMLFRGIHGIAFGISSTASLVLVSECAPKDRMAEAVSYFSIMSVATMAVGPSLGIIISERMGYQACMLASTLVLFAAAAATVSFPYAYEKKEAEEKTGFSAGNLVETKLIGLTCVNASFTMMNGMVSAFLVVFALERGIEGVSWHFTLNALVLILSRIVLAKRMGRWSLAKNLYPAFACAILGLWTISAAYSLSFLLIAAVLKAFGSGMSQPVLQTEALRIVPPHRRGVACSTMYIGGDLGQAIGPMLGGVVAEHTGYGNMFLWCIAPLAVCLIYFILRERRLRTERI